MAHVERSIVIAANPDRIWEVVTNPNLAPQWNSNIVEVHSVSDMPVRPGTAWTQTVRVLGKPTLMTARIVECQPPRYGVVELAGPGTARVTTLIEPLDGECRLTQIMDITLPGGFAGKLASRLAQMTVERELEESLRRQKSVLEEPGVGAERNQRVAGEG